MVAPSRPGGAASTGTDVDDNIEEIPEDEIVMNEAQQAASEEAMLEGSDINESTATAYEEVPDDAEPPTEEEAAALEEKIDAEAEEGAKETENELAPEDKPQNQEVQKPIPNYKTKIKVPDELVLAMRKVGVGKTALERAHFLAQVGAETGGFRVKTESLMYSAGRLFQIFPKYFKSEAQANEYAKNEQKIGNYVYGNRLGNGGESTGEGFKFRGRGMLQVTGKVNYQKFGKMVNEDWTANPDLVAKTKGGAESACLFWKTNNIAKYATDASIKQINLCGWRVNGVNPPNGAAERIKEFNKYWAELQKDPTLWA
jgi:putative chitinase